MVLYNCRTMGPWQPETSYGGTASRGLIDEEEIARLKEVRLERFRTRAALL
jgi:hypothetical protein